MANYVITNGGTVAGTAGVDTLTYIYNTTTNGVWTSNWSGDMSTGYSGYFNGLASNDGTFSGIERFEFIDNSGGDDIIRTGDYDDTLRGGGGDDLLNSGRGEVIVDGGAGIDVWEADLSSATSAVVFNLNVASTFLTSSSIQNIEAARVITGSANDILTGHQTAYAVDDVETGAGNDRLVWFMNGDDSIDGGSGIDTLRVTYNAETNGVWLLGPIADDQGALRGTFNGKESNDLSFSNIERISFTDLSGGDDWIQTGRFNDTLRGGGGNDTLESGSGHDVIDGGDGLDLWHGNRGGATVAQVINLNTVSNLSGGGVVRDIEGIDVITGSGADQITGHRTASLADKITTRGGGDQITLWLAGSDEVNGGTGNDRLTVTVAAASGSSGVWLTDLVAGDRGNNGTFNGDSSNDIRFTGIDRFVFRDLAVGADDIRTGSGADQLFGGGGNDILKGGAGQDTLRGGAGADNLTGGAGNDLLGGGTGADRFEYDRTVGEGSDLIEDFTNGSDLIRLIGGSMADIALSSIDAGRDTRITLDSGTVIVLDNVALGTINAADFLFS